MIYVGGDYDPVTFYAFSGAGSVAFPVGLAVGDLMLLQQRGDDPATPSGWTGITNWDFSTGGIVRHAYKFATSGDISAGSVTLSPNGSLRSIGGLLHVWRDPAVTSFAVGATPLNYGSRRQVGDPADTSIDVPSYTTVIGRVFWIGAYAGPDASTIALPVGFTLVPLSPTGASPDGFTVGYQDVAAAGVVAAQVGTVSTSKQNAGAIYTVPWPVPPPAPTIIGQWGGS